MASEMEELLEQATTQCEAFSKNVGTASDAIDEILSHARQLDQAMDGGVREVRNALTALTERLEKAAGEIGDACDGAEDALSDASSKAGDAKDELQELSERADGGSTTVDEAAEKAGADLGSKYQEAQQAFNGYGAEVSAFSQSTAQHVEATKGALEEFAQEIDGARDDLEEKKEGWLKSLDSYTDAVVKEGKEAVEALAASLKAQAEGMLEAGNGTLLEHNEAMEAIKAGFAEQAVEALGDALSPVADALQAVTELASRRQGELTPRAQQSVSRIEALVPQLAALAERLRNANELV
jgi:ABC-type transporter Mla subunit MlaD